MPGVSMFSKTNYAQQIPKKPVEGWSKYLKSISLRDGAAASAGGPAQMDEGMITLSDTEDELMGGVEEGDDGPAPSN